MHVFVSMGLGLVEKTDQGYVGSFFDVVCVYFRGGCVWVGGHAGCFYSRGFVSLVDWREDVVDVHTCTSTVHPTLTHIESF